MFFKNSKKRSIIKAFTWRLIATLDTFILSYLILLQSNYSIIKTASLIASFEILTKVFIYYVHERIWEKLEWGKTT